LTKVDRIFLSNAAQTTANSRKALAKRDGNNKQVCDPQRPQAIQTSVMVAYR
jgi:hypothetical protein